MINIESIMETKLNSIQFDLKANEPSYTEEQRWKAEINHNEFDSQNLSQLREDENKI